MVGIGQDQAGIQFGELSRSNCLYCCLGAHRCEYRGLNWPVWRLECPGPGTLLTRLESKSKRLQRHEV